MGPKQKWIVRVPQRKWFQRIPCLFPSKIEWDRIPTDPVQRKLRDRAIRYSGLGVHSVGPVGDFLDYLSL